MIILINEANMIYIVDSCLNQLKIMSTNIEGPFLQLNNDSLFSNINKVSSERNSFILITKLNIGILSVLSRISLVDVHLKSNHFSEAVQCLDVISTDKDYAAGFYLLCDYALSHIDVEIAKTLETIWTKSCHTRLIDANARNLMIRIGYQLLSAGIYEQAFLLARKLRSLRLLNDIAYSTDAKGFRGISTLAKYERETLDEEYISPKQELEEIIKKTGRVMTAADYAMLLNDYEEIMNISTINDALGKGGYIEEKNF